MLALQGRNLSVEMNEEGSGLVLTDRARGCRWRLAPAHQGYRLAGEKDKFAPLAAGRAEKQGDALVVTYPVPGGSARFRWSLADDHAQVELQCDSSEVECVALPGAVFAEGAAQEIAIPFYQGLLLRGPAAGPGQGGEAWQRVCSHGGHFNFSMAMGAALAPNGGLLVTHECHSNWQVAFGQEPGGPFFRFEQRRCPVDGWVGAAARFYPVAPDVTAVCKRYRRRVKERGELVLWPQKIAERPMVKELFGGLMAFVGYNRWPETDYVGCARRLREMGFTSVFYYPLRMLQYSLGFQMGGDDPIWLDDATLEAIRAIPGAHPAPWAWCVEGLDDGSEAMHSIYLRDEAGRPVPNWRIDQFQWYLVCTPYQIEHMKRRFATDMKAMDWVHYDVSAMFAGRNCFSSRHALHGNRPLGRLADMDWVRKLFSAGTVGNRVVSSEGFGDHYAGWYDVGSTKIMPAAGERPLAVPVPMTMLVFHDSCIHDWWEVHNYNAHPGFPLGDVPHGLGRTGCGLPRLKAAMDALAGSPPNVFPFGKQYAWSNFQKRESFSYVVRLEDAAVQEALAAALPVTKLHRTVGPCELVSWEALSADRLVQATTFSNGTRVVANLSDRPQEAPGAGLLPPHDWRAE